MRGVLVRGFVPLTALLVMGALLAAPPLASPAAAATATASANVSVTCATPMSLSGPATPWQIRTTLSPANPFRGSAVSAQVTATPSAGIVNDGPVQIGPGERRFEVRLTVAGASHRLVGPTNSHTAQSSGGLIFGAGEPLTATGSFLSPSSAGNHPVVLAGVYVNGSWAEPDDTVGGPTDDMVCFPAGAGGQPFPSPRASLAVRPDLVPDLRSLKATDILIRNGNCQTVALRPTWSGLDQPHRVYLATAEVRRDGRLVDTAVLGSGRTSQLWCPYIDGAGRFVVGPTEISYTDPRTSDSHTRKDGTTGSFFARYASKLKVRSSRVGPKVTLKITASRFQLADGFVKHARTATVQYKAKRAWKKLRTVKVKKAGTSVTVKAAKKRTYRVVASASSTVAATKSSTTRR